MTNMTSSALEYLLQCQASKYSHVYDGAIHLLHNKIKDFYGKSLLNICKSGSFAKGTAIHGSSDIDYLVSLRDNDSTLKETYNELYSFLAEHYRGMVYKQNVSIRVKIQSLEVDVTPGRRRDNTNIHSIYVTKSNTWKQTDIQKHINDVKDSGKTKEIKLLKIWRNRNNLDFPSIYLEYLVIGEILKHKSETSIYSLFFENLAKNFSKTSIYSPFFENLAKNFSHIINELARNDDSNPLFARVIDPANSNNILSDLLTKSEKMEIIKNAKSELARSSFSKSSFLKPL